MSSNPYDMPKQPVGSDFDAGAVPEPERTSKLAVTGFVIALPSAVCCLLPVVTAVTGLLGAFLGIVSVVRMSSKPWLRGRGFAVTAIVLGFLSAALSTATAIGLSMAMNMLGTYGQFAAAVDAQNRPAVDSFLSASAASSLTAEQFEAFRAAVAGDWGAYERVPKGLGDWFAQYAGPAGRMIGTVQGQYGSNDFPMPVKYANGWTVMIVRMDQSQQGPAGPPSIANVGVVEAGGASIVWLLSPQGP